ncbi:hypothetical protein O181_045043 [Austropuccinia psidii MF-1]|uniref:HMG box domain-containing protein n=1 Tax=Austropuccinia psidii MF-1 TaxID=1389203 RepID=A0A9Q3HH77_9BASI|nr:hypothetical protein [Austropuccinia psidii MF-1]
MVSQPSPALSHTLPFISSPDSTNTTPSTTAPPPSSTTPSDGRSNHLYPTPTTLDRRSNTHVQSHQVDLKPNSLTGTAHQDNSSENVVDHDQNDAFRPLLETDGVVSSEVGAVPGILHQDLHPDGQPRRPMNAFMIFARHRRPAIQAKEPGLKTGEISKRLSHDWKHLPEEDKSHYLEQAKLLKDEFHSRFPEYVYKRRPNNTGKRRSSISQGQLQPKFSGGLNGQSSMGATPQASMNNGIPHTGDMHTHHYHLHPPHGDMYNSSQTHHLTHHSHPQPSSRPLSSITQPSPKIPSHTFYSSSINPSSPRYHHITQQPPGSTLARPPPSNPYSIRAPTSTPGTTSGSAVANSPRLASPAPTQASGTNGVSYMRVPNPHAMSHHSQQAPSHYSWFANENSYGSTTAHHAAQAQAPMSAGRSSFYYPPWPTSGTPDSQSISASASNNHSTTDSSDPSIPASHSRAASYSAGPTLYRPPSPGDRTRQLSLPSHSLSTGTTSMTEAASNGSCDAASPYPNRSHSDQQAAQNGVNSSSTHTYVSYPSDVMSNTQRTTYGNGSIATSFGTNSGRNSLIPASNGQKTNNDSQSSYDHASHHSSTLNSNNSNLTQHSNHEFSATHCSPLHHPPPPQPPPAAATSHHQHPTANSGSASITASVAY